MTTKHAERLLPLGELLNGPYVTNIRHRRAKTFQFAVAFNKEFEMA